MDQRCSFFAGRVAAGALMVVAAVTVGGPTALAGPLNPPAGPIAPTPGPEARIAINATNTPGDSDSHFRIVQPGSYYLTGNISLPSNEKAIEILIAGGQQVTIDLNGFTIGASDAARTLAAISSDNVDAHVTIRNGSIRNWANAVVQITGGSMTLENVKAYGSRLIQFDLKDATVTRCLAEDGGNTGFFLDRAVVVDCISRGNTGNGFTFTGTPGSIRGSIATLNGASGFDLAGSTADSCVADSNGDDGFVNPGAMMNCSAVSNDDDGVRLGLAGTVRFCNITGNGGDGIQVGGTARIEGNVLASNAAHGVNVTASRTSVVGNTIASSGRGAGAFAGVSCSANDCTIDGNHITNMLVGGDDFGVLITGSSNLFVRNQISGVSSYFGIGAGNTSGGTSSTPATAGPWTNITY